MHSPGVLRSEAKCQKLLLTVGREARQLQCRVCQQVSLCGSAQNRNPAHKSGLVPEYRVRFRAGQSPDMNLHRKCQPRQLLAMQRLAIDAYRLRATVNPRTAQCVPRHEGGGV